MASIKLDIPIELTATFIIRAAENIDESSAHALAVELHDIIAKVQQYYADRPRRVEAGRLRDEPADLVWSVLRTSLNYWPEDKSAAANEFTWIAEHLMDMGDLYDRYLRVFDRIAGADFAEAMDEGLAELGDLPKEPPGRPQ